MRGKEEREEGSEDVVTGGEGARAGPRDRAHDSPRSLSF